MEMDPVCGAPVDADRATDSVEYKGRRYYFCSSKCRKLFEENPEHWAATPDPKI
jgi:YHS domain-containing protein